MDNWGTNNRGTDNRGTDNRGRTVSPVNEDRFFVKATRCTKAQEEPGKW